MRYKIEVLSSNHHKKNFSCGYEMLDNYIHQQAKQDVKRDLSACFVLCEAGKADIIGYYTLSSGSVNRSEFPEHLSRKLPPHYHNLPTILLGRLAIDDHYQSRGLGEMLLIDALNRCMEISNNLGTLAVVVDPIDKTAEIFYIKYGFIKLPGTEKMFIPMKTVRDSV